jgi:hypothetical protein
VSDGVSLTLRIALLLFGVACMFLNEGVTNRSIWQLLWLFGGPRRLAPWAKTFGQRLSLRQGKRPLEPPTDLTRPRC